MSSADNLHDSLEPVQAGQNIGLDLYSNCLTPIVNPEFFFEKVNFEKNQQTTKKHAKLPSKQRVYPEGLITNAADVKFRKSLSHIWWKIRLAISYVLLLADDSYEMPSLSLI